MDKSSIFDHCYEPEHARHRTTGGKIMELKALNKIGYGLYILTTRDGEKDNGCIINTVCQVSANPDRIMISVSNSNYTCEMIKKSGVFNVSVLTEETPFYVFEHFGFSSGRDKDKFEKNDNLFRTENGIYVVPKYANSFICAKVTDMTDLGSHTLFIATVTRQEVLTDEVSITYDYYHKNTKPKPHETNKVGYRCEICGYIYEGDDLPEDFICPICKHGSADFKKI